MLSEELQSDILNFYYDIWLENPYENTRELDEMVKDSTYVREEMIENAHYLIDKGFLEPLVSHGFDTGITLEGVLFVEKHRYSKDVKLRVEILRKIYEEYETRPGESVDFSPIQSELELKDNEIQRNLMLLRHLGLIDSIIITSVGIEMAKITSRGIDSLNEPSILEYNSEIMSSSYSKLYKLENILREYLEETLRYEYGEGWWEIGIPQQVRTKVKSNKEKDSNDLSNMNYTDFGHLKDIIIFEKNWKHLYEPIFKKQTGIVSRLEELEPIRHSIAHTRMLIEDEITKLNLFLKEIYKMMQGN